MNLSFIESVAEIILVESTLVFKCSCVDRQFSDFIYHVKSSLNLRNDDDYEKNNIVVYTILTDWFNQHFSSLGINCHKFIEVIIMHRQHHYAITFAPTTRWNYKISWGQMYVQHFVEPSMISHQYKSFDPHRRKNENQ